MRVFAIGIYQISAKDKEKKGMQQILRLLHLSLFKKRDLYCVEIRSSIKN